MDYDDMLERGLEETPEIAADSERLSVPDVEVRQEGNVTVVENFQNICEALGRDPDRVIKFLQNEVGTSGHIDESGRGRLTGEFDGPRLAEAVDAYVEEFVRCPECGLPDTRLEREQGALLLVCEACGARSPTG
ncbi:MAG: translation initiation factor IF-2 subunit beta [Salinirussus sp.]